MNAEPGPHGVSLLRHHHLEDALDPATEFRSYCAAYELQYFIRSDVPGYAILSHCWGENEVMLQDYDNIDKDSAHFQTGPKFKRIRDCCQLAFDHDIDWASVDTCCIAKTSSAELSEAIDSMFAWYKSALLCYALLEDAPASGRLDLCRWFTRDSKLQELLAPRIV